MLITSTYRVQSKVLVENHIPKTLAVGITLAFAHCYILNHLV